MQIDFVQLCRDYSIEYRILVDGWVNINCPYHSNGDRGFKGGFNTSGGYYHCWHCGGTGLKKILFDIAGIDYAKADKLLEQYSGYSSAVKKLRKNNNTVNKKIKLPCSDLNTRCKNYLIKRGYNPDFLESKYKITGAALSGEWAGRLIIPIFYKEKLVSFQGRSLYSKKKCKELNILRYKTLSVENSVIDPKNTLYNIDNCNDDYLIVMEGAFDVWKWGDNAVGTLGTSVTDRQKLLMLQYKRIILLFDPEKEAQERASKLGKELAALGAGDVSIVDTELGHDPGDMADKEILRIRKALKI